MTGRNANLRENGSVSFKCWKEFSAFVLAKVDKTRMNNHIPNTILGLSLFFQFHLLHIFSTTQR